MNPYLFDPMQRHSIAADRLPRAGAGAARSSGRRWHVAWAARLAGWIECTSYLRALRLRGATIHRPAAVLVPAPCVRAGASCC